MSRFGTGLGFNKYNASLWGGGTEIFTANVANFLGTGYTTTTNLNKSSLTSITEEAWIKVTGSNLQKGIISISGTEAFNCGVARCFDLVDSAIQASCFYGVSLANYTGYTGQEKTDLSGNAIVTTDVGATLDYTGSAQIECEA